MTDIHTLLSERMMAQQHLSNLIDPKVRAEAKIRLHSFLYGCVGDPFKAMSENAKLVRKHNYALKHGCKSSAFLRCIKRIGKLK